MTLPPGYVGPHAHTRDPDQHGLSKPGTLEYLFEVQAWEMRNVGLDSRVWIIGNHLGLNIFGPAREATFHDDWLWQAKRACRDFLPKDMGHPMTYQWRRW